MGRRPAVVCSGGSTAVHVMLRMRTRHGRAAAGVLVADGVLGECEGDSRGL